MTDQVTARAGTPSPAGAERDETLGPTRPVGSPPAPGRHDEAQQPEQQPGFTRRQRWGLAAIALAILAAYTTYACARHAKYETTGFDLGIFDQVVRAYAHFDAPISPLKGIGYNILGDHFHPILVLLAPLYWVWADPRMLLGAQAALFAVSIVPVAAFARRRFGGTAALWMAAAYGVSWPLERAVHFDFHEIAFAVPLIALLVDAMDRRRDRIVIVCCLTLLLVREDMGALVVLVGLLVALRRPLAGVTPGSAGRRPRLPGPARRRSVLLGAGLATIGMAGYWLATSVIIPMMGPQGFTYWTFTALGPDPVSAARFALTQPWRVAWLMVTPTIKAQTLFAIFLPTAFLTLLSPYVLLSVPFLAERMLNDRKELWQTNFHYTSVIAPILMMGAADTVFRLCRRFPRLSGGRRPAVPAWLRGLPPSGLRRAVGGRLGRPVNLLSVWLVWCVASVTGGLISLSPNYPVSGLWSGRVWVRDTRWHAVHDLLRKIPAGECVEADNQIAPQLTGRDYVTRILEPEATPSPERATWVIVDKERKETGWEGPTPARAIAQRLQRGYTIVLQQGKIVLMHKNQPIAPICRDLY